MKFDINSFRRPWALNKTAFEDMANYLKGEDISFPAERPVMQNIVEKGVAVIHLHGILTKEEDFLSFLFGGTSLEAVQRDYQEALADDSVSAIILDIDSPGGDVNGTPEFAEMVFNSRGIKPIISYVGFTGASAAYWIAAAADAIVMQEASAVGSIGVMASFFKNNTDDEITIVSSVSPNKDVDLNTDEGVAQIQARVDELGNIFVNNVAKYRGVAPEKVISDFGKGDVLIASKAVPAGMADHIGGIDTVYEMLDTPAKFKKQGANMALLKKNKLKAEMVDPADIDRSWLEKNKPELIDEVKEDQAAGETINVDDINLDWIKENKPELIDEIEEGAQDEERERIEEVDEEEKNSDDTSEEAQAIFKSAKFKKPITAAQAVLKVTRLAATRRKELKEARHEDAAEVPSVNEQAVGAETPGPLVSILLAQAKKQGRTK